MTKQNLQSYQLPDEPGVYFFLFQGQIIYIGKATSLKDRVKSYFSGDLIDSRGPLVVKIIQEADELKWQQTDSVLEALILESNLIKKYKPFGNTKDKDDKSHLYVVVTKEDWPRVLSVRGRDLIEVWEPENIKYTFGPFPQATELKAALKIIRKIFPFRDKCQPESGRLCFSAQIGLCPGMCGHQTTKKEYARTINHLRLFFQGRKSDLIKKVDKDMKQAIVSQDFELAAVYRDRIFTLNHINDIALLQNKNKTSDLRVEAYDIAHTSGKNTIGVMTVVAGGVPLKSAYRKFKIKGAGQDKNNDVLNLTEILQRRFDHLEWPLPNLVVLDGSRAQLNAGQRVLTNLGFDIPIVAVVKDEHHRPKEIIGSGTLARQYEMEILLANSEAHRFALSYHRKERGRLLQ
ncbi:MAG: UvrB/UvrC motif-containing protein [Candidatus Paceibacterota bacterium]